MIKLIPGFDDDALLAVVEHCTALKAIVLELYGTGNSPSRRKEFVRFIKVRHHRHCYGHQGVVPSTSLASSRYGTIEIISLINVCGIIGVIALIKVWFHQHRNRCGTFFSSFAVF